MAKSRNLLATIVSVTGGAADTEFTVAHGLVSNEGVPIIPRGYIVCRRGQDASLYASGTAWTGSLAYFKANMASAWFVVLFIG